MSLILINIVLLLAISMAYAPPPPETTNTTIPAKNVEDVLSKLYNHGRVSAPICGVGWECVPRHLCQNDDTVNNDGKTIISFRIDDESEKCSTLQTCCSLDRQIPEKTETTEKTKNSGTMREQYWLTYSFFLGMAVLSKYFWSLKSL